MGNPLATAVAAESLSIIIEESPLQRIAEIECYMKSALSELKCVEGVSDVRVLGAIGVVEMCEDVDMATIQRMFVEEGVWVRPFGKLVYIMPQYIISDEQLAKLCSSLVKVVKTVVQE